MGETQHNTTLRKRKRKRTVCLSLLYMSGKLSLFLLSRNTPYTPTRPLFRLSYVYVICAAS